MTETESSSVLSVRDLMVHYPTDEGVVKALDGVSLDIQPGQTLGVVGESGCGKSTIGRAILRILDKPGQIVGGEILWNDPEKGSGSRPVDLTAQEPNGPEMRAIRGGDIALVFQEPMTSFSPIHTIGNQMSEAITLHQDKTAAEAKEWSMELMNMVGIPNPPQRFDEYSYQLSGGLRQRAMIAMAISCGPKLLIADEPTTALDVTTQAQILDLLRGLQEKNNMAIMLITHNLGVIAEMADEVVVMYLGRAVESGPVDDIFHQAKHPYSRGLLESIPSVLASGRERLPSIAGSIPHPFNRPSGCTFRPRCPSFIPGTCDVNVPQYLALGGGQQKVSCFLHHSPSGVEEVSSHD
ncbi:MAG: ABC transporter ATP-binding protein [Chloroflexi bacterium]|nr:ABC transporter ATP-binding protein [Chloroflexota bacterium]